MLTVSIFSNLVEASILFIVSAVCGCDPVGTVPGSQCTTYGGQCPCRPGVVGRTCHACDIGFYGFSAAGCRRKNASNCFVEINFI